MRWRGASRHIRIAVKYALIVSVLVNFVLLLHRYQLKHGRMAVNKKGAIVQRQRDIPPKLNRAIEPGIPVEVKTPKETFVVVEDRHILNNTNEKAQGGHRPLRHLKRVKGRGFSIFLFSAVIGNSSQNSSWDKISVQGWEIKNFTHNVSCCVHYSSGALLSYPAVSQHWYIVSAMVATQYVCPVRMPPNVSAKHVSIGDEKSPCHRLVNWYLVPTLAYSHGNQIAVCSKLAYGSLSADDILSWFEVHRRLGVNKVLTYTFNLNPAAQRVLDYYTKIGMAEVMPFELPETGEKRATVGVKNNQGWVDEQVCVYDCLERLKGYKYVLTIDFDEYLIPKDSNITLPTLFKKLFRKRPAAAGFQFWVQVHVTTWGQTSQGSKFKAGQYLNRTKPMLDRLKHVVKPERLTQGGLATHSYSPRHELGFKRFIADKKEAVIHHFRSCRKDWERKEKNFCMNLERIHDTSVADQMHSIENNVLALNKTIFEGS